MMVGLGVLGIAATFLRIVGNSAPVNPVLSAAVVGMSLVLVLLGVFVNPRFRHRLDRRHSFSRFGRVRSVDERALHTGEGRAERCVNCGSRLNEGLVRRYREEVCFAGIPVFTSSEDYNYYCVECAAAELGVSAQSDDAQARPEKGSKDKPQLTTERH